MEEKKEDYGHITIGVGTTNEKVEIDNWMSAFYKDGRKVTIIRVEGNRLAITIENHKSSNRSAKQEMLLTEESFIAIYASMSLHMLAEGSNLEEIFDKSTNRGEVDYACSPNLNLQ
ncbi:MAG: hypothetical protein ACI9N9_000054 [Enterobacterales bacterium]|jgi:hypothetical protein